MCGVNWVQIIVDVRVAYMRKLYFLSNIGPMVTACKLEGLQTDVSHTCTEHLLPVKNHENRLLITFTYSIHTHYSRIWATALAQPRGR